MSKLSRDAWVMISMLVILLLIAVVAGSRQDKSKTNAYNPRRTSYSTAPAGLKALYDTLDRLDYRTRRHIDELTIQPADGILFLIAPNTPVSYEEKLALRGWVERGNTLIVVSGSDYFTPSPDKQPKTDKTTPALPSFLASDVRSFNVAGPNRIDEKVSVLDDCLSCSIGFG